MTTSPEVINPLRQCRIDDVCMHRLAPKTQASYVGVVRQFTVFLGRSPGTATIDDLRGYQLYLVDHGASLSSLIAAITGLKFFFMMTLCRGDLMAKIPPGRLRRALPLVLSPEEVGSHKPQTAAAAAYGAGLRVGEVIALKGEYIEGKRLTLCGEQSKGNIDRYAMLSPIVLERLRIWRRVARAQGRMLGGGWLYRCFSRVEPLSARQLNRTVHTAALAADLEKRVSMHIMRQVLSQ